MNTEAGEHIAEDIEEGKSKSGSIAVGDGMNPTNYMIMYCDGLSVLE